jgi:hypothetical protein
MGAGLAQRGAITTKKEDFYRADFTIFFFIET